MKRAQYMDFEQQKAAENKSFVETAVEQLLQRKISRAVENALHEIGFDWTEAKHEAEWYASKLRDCGHIGVTSDKLLAIYAADNYSDDDLIDENEVYGDD